MSCGSDEDVCDFFHVGGEEIHANVYYNEADLNVLYSISKISMLTINNCIKHVDKEITHLCLAEDCKEELFLCD